MANAVPTAELRPDKVNVGEPVDVENCACWNGNPLTGAVSA